MMEGSYCTMFGTGLVVSWIYLRFYQVRFRGAVKKKKNSIFTDIVQIGGREVNPISKKLKEMNF